MHLSKLTAVLERAWTNRVRAVVHAPPRHGKTDTISHWIAATLLRFPRTRIGYVTYSAELSLSKSKEMQEIAARAGVELGGLQKLSEWQTTKGGGVFVTGVGGGLTGRGLNYLIIDDPIKNRVEAESALIRERTQQWYTSTARTRLQPGASVIVTMTRWHEDDLSGRLLRSGHFEDIALPALDPSTGEALWPQQYPKHELEQTMVEVGPYDWSSLYLGRPMPRGTAVFGDCTIYTPDMLPQIGYQESIGVDLAYSRKTKADHSVDLVLRRCAGLYYVIVVDRMQVAATQFKARLAERQKQHPRAKARWYAYGAEKGVGDFMNEQEPRVKIEVIQMAGDKFVRAQPVAAAWAAGKVLVPEHAPWVSRFLSELGSFTGVEDAEDDQVDALAAAYDVLAPNSGADKIRAIAKW